MVRRYLTFRRGAKVTCSSQDKCVEMNALIESAQSNSAFVSLKPPSDLDLTMAMFAERANPHPTSLRRDAVAA
jgi:hypothetical protein